MKCLLYVRHAPDLFTFRGPFPLYSLALLEGQRLGRGQFYIATKDRVPTRETQLGLADDTYVKYKLEKKRSKKSKLIEQD